jgi:DNA-binding XRE family transcriptional regulator
MTAKEICKALRSGEFTAEELREIRTAYQMAQQMLALEVRSTLKVGSMVQFAGRGNVIKGKVVKVNRKTAHVVENGTNSKWRVSVQLLEKVAA